MLPPASPPHSPSPLAPWKSHLQFCLLCGCGLLRTRLLPGPLLKDLTSSLCQKEGLLPPRCCRQNWRSSSNHFTACQTPHMLSFVSVPLLMPLPLHKMWTCLSLSNHPLIDQASSPDTLVPGQPFPDRGLPPSRPPRWKWHLSLC